MLLKIAVVLAAIPLSFFSLFAATGVLFVDVTEAGPGGHRLLVPVPLLAVQMAASFVPLHKAQIDLREAERYLPAAEKVLAALAAAPDGELVRVEERGEQVIVRKVRGSLEVQVRGPRETVDAHVPLSVARDVLRACRGGRIEASEVVGALRSARFTDLVDVRDGNDRVKVWVF